MSEDHDRLCDLLAWGGPHEPDCGCARRRLETRLGEREAMVSALASLVAFAYLVDVEFSPEWMDAARQILGSVGWEVDPQDWRNWDWSTGADVDLTVESTGRVHKAWEAER